MSRTNGGRLLASLRRAFCAWLSLELGAGLLALVLLVALLPAVILLLPTYLEVAVPPWATAVDVMVTSVPLAAILGISALRLPLEVRS